MGEKHIKHVAGEDAKKSPKKNQPTTAVGTMLASERLELFQQVAVRYLKEMVALDRENEDTSAPEAAPPLP